MIVVETDTLDFLNLRTYVLVPCGNLCITKWGMQIEVYGYENELSLSKYFSSILQTDMLYVRLG